MPFVLRCLLRPFLFISLPFGALNFSSCQHHTTELSSSSISNPEKPRRIRQKYAPPMARPLALRGKNRQASFSPDGQFIIYVSRGRGGHKNSQVYEMHLSSGREKRLTFQNGENRDPLYHPDGKQVIYASSTDELKEGAWPMKDSSTKGEEKKELHYLYRGEKNLPYEIYMSYRDGTQIKRLTRSPNYDAKIRTHPNGKSLFFSSLRTGNLGIFKMNLSGKKPKPPKPWNPVEKSPHASDEAHISDEVHISKDGKNFVWVKYSDTLQESQIYMTKVGTQQVTRLTTRKARHRSPIWYPDNEHIIFSSTRSSAENFELYVMKKDGSCVNRLTYALGDDLDPEVSPER